MAFCFRLNRAVCMSRLLLFCIALSACPAIVLAERPSASDYSHASDEILLLNTRRAGCSSAQGGYAGLLQLHQRDPSGRFHQAPLELLSAGARPDVPTIFYIHGNRVEWKETVPFGMRVYRTITARRCDPRPIRFVMVAWPSDQEPGVLNDTRTKASRTDPASLQLAWAIDRTPVDTPLGLLGYSFGARIATGAAHLLSGGRLGGLRLESQTQHAKRPMEAFLVASALDCWWLGPGQRHGLAMSQFDHLATTVNRSDPAMRFYRFLDPRRDPIPLGYAGAGRLSAEYASRIRQFDVTDRVGMSHDLTDYLAAPGIAREAWRRLSFEGRVPAAPLAEASASPLY